MKNRILAIILTAVLILSVSSLPVSAIDLPDVLFNDEQYTVRFVDFDGTLISMAVYNYNDTVTVPSDPERPADETYTYVFSGWDKPVAAVTEDATYTATYTGTYIEYTVTFKDYNGDVLSEKTYHYGDFVIIPDAPARPDDEKYTYSFKTWQPPVAAVTGNAEYTAVYKAVCLDGSSYGVLLPDVPISDDTYTVRFVDDDGTVISETIYNYDDTVTVPDDPVKPADETYTYTFSGWDKPVVTVTEDASYTATYTATYIDYTVIFKNYNGDVLSEATYHYGETVTVPEDPSKPADETYAYAFNGWDKPVTVVTGDTTYTATFTGTYIDYTVIFKNYNGDVLSEATYHYGETVTIPENPSKPADETYTYVFNGWDKPITAVTGDTVYTATFNENYIDYTVTFKNYNGDVLSETAYHYGETVTVPEDPAKPADETYTYAFNGWDKPVTAVTGDAVYTATFNETYIDYTVIFKNYNGDVLSEATYHYGETVTVPADPAKPADETYTYAFNGWDKPVTAVTGDAVYTATFNEIYIDYTVIFKNYNGDVLSEATYHYGEDVTVPEDPSKPSDNVNNYVFTGWDKPVAAVTGNATYTAVFDAVIIEYTVKFVDYDGTVISETKYGYNDPVTAPDNPVRPGDGINTYTFAGWDKDITVCLGDETYTATYTTDVNIYTVTFRNYDNTLISVRTYHYGEQPAVPASPVRASDGTYYYVFSGWDSEVVPVTDNAEYTAVFEAKEHEWTEPAYEWSADRTSVTASRSSKNDASIIQTETAGVTVAETEAGCESNGKKVYTAVFANAAFAAQTYEETIPATGHDMRFTGFRWDETDAYAEYKCENCEKTLSVKADVTTSVTEPGCETEGETVYTASVKAEDTPDGTARTDVKRVKISASGHSWSFNGFVWEQISDGYEADASFTCGECGNTETAKASVTVSVTPASCEAAGEAVYTATLEAKDSPDGQKHTGTKTVTIPQTDHNWSLTGFEWNNGKTGAEAVFTCAGCEQTRRITANITRSENNGVITYTASVTFNNNVYTDEKTEYIDYTVKFVDYNGGVISEKTYHYGDSVTVPADPSRGADNTYTYAFAGWDKPVSNVAGDATYTATYTANYINYVVKFVDYNCGVISENTYHYGDSVTVPADPSRGADNTYTYAFAGWDKPVSNVTGDATYTATYTANYINYVVKFVDYNGGVISEKTYHYGDNVTVPADPGREDDENYTYTFTGWDKEITAVTSDAEYTAVYERKEKEPPVIPYDINGDGETDNKDVVLLFRYLCGEEVEVNEEMLDVNGDGKINNKDVTVLFRILNG